MSSKIRSLFQGFRSSLDADHGASGSFSGDSDSPTTSTTTYDSSPAAAIPRRAPPTPPDEKDNHHHLKTLQHFQQSIPVHSKNSSPSSTTSPENQHNHNQHKNYENRETMTDAQQIEVNGLVHSISHTLSLSNSPTSTFHSPVGSYNSRTTFNRPSGKQLKPFNTQDIKILLLENVNVAAREILESQGYQVEFHKSSLPEDQLVEKIRDVHVIGIRSKTKLSAKVLREAKNLLVIGCFCIGTNQVDLEYAAKHGISVFNSPFSNSRSVAELVISEIIALARQLGDRSMEMHNGTWNKVSARCWEIRGKILGIIGYGHIGSQLSVLSEAMGMKVIYYDVVPLMALGTAKQVPTLKDLLEQADFVTLHVPEIPETKNMIGAEQLAQMKQGSYLINASRGSVVDIPALIESMRSGHTAGAALDVYPSEPAANGDYFNDTLNTWGNDLRSLKNLILTPHIGGSTEEAQSAIGVEVGEALVRYINSGSTIGCVNMPEVTLRSLTLAEENHVRVIFIHSNRPGVLRQVNSILGDHNVDKQMSDSRGDVAYLMADISDVNAGDIRSLYESLEALSSKIMTRVLY
ncbi:D-3-phosphoglycerate dehydrogenase 2 [Choiromyces venosus 120613-1]|uniref:2-oxoglutarate reductase n=1 Tax=Choiromyces venosus 120613-1 TaxID=1336337 RepID=A0A3N4K8C4_9PEZI|nr:D-3-phosphoglycerate dehydrogenase 2 [Choiromyces venosus 120613-1]